MEKEMLMSDIDVLIDSIASAIEYGNWNFSNILYDGYDKINEASKNNSFLVTPLLTRSDIQRYKNESGTYGSYTAIQTSLKQLKARLEIYHRKNPRTFVSPHFKDIKSFIIEEIEKASFIIWIAVAWFTDTEIYNALLSAKNRGINVQVLTLDHKGNKNNGSFILDFKGKIEAKYFPGYETHHENLHHKFCMIDFERTITGSYNWTNNAEKNHEDVVFLYDPVTAVEYANRFIDLKKQSSYLSS